MCKEENKNYVKKNNFININMYLKLSINIIKLV